MSLAVKEKTADLVKCVVVDGGELKSRRHLNVRGKSANLPSITGDLFFDIFLRIVFFFYIYIFSMSGLIFCHITSDSNRNFLCMFNLHVNLADKDWEDIKFGVDNQVDFYAVSFVKDAKVVLELKDYLKSNSF